MLIPLTLLFALVFGAIGFLDDYEKLKKKQNLGLTAGKKLLLQLAAAVAFIFQRRASIRMAGSALPSATESAARATREMNSAPKARVMVRMLRSRPGSGVPPVSTEKRNREQLPSVRAQRIRNRLRIIRQM